MNYKPSQTIYCAECGKPLDWVLSRGFYTPDVWLVRCGNAGTGGNQDGCLLCGTPFRPDQYTQPVIAERRAFKLIYAAGKGIIYHNPGATNDFYLSEAVRLGVLPSDWDQWVGAAQRKLEDKHS